MTISNPDSLSSRETGVNPEIRSWKKKHSTEWAQCQEAIGGIYFTKKWRAETLQPGSEFDGFEPRLKSGIFKCTSWVKGSFFWEWIGVFWKKESGPIEWHQRRLVFCSHVHSAGIWTVFITLVWSNQETNSCYLCAGNSILELVWIVWSFLNLTERSKEIRPSRRGPAGPAREEHGSFRRKNSPQRLRGRTRSQVPGNGRDLRVQAHDGLHVSSKLCPSSASSYYDSW